MLLISLIKFKMSEKTLNFIEHIIEEDLKAGLSKNLLRFRFPPEPNGYLHIGHVKAICLNFNLGKRYQAPVNLRFDDTNPAKEESQYVKAIKNDIQWLGFQWDKECYASDYFSQLYQWSKTLIIKGLAYVDSQTSQQISEQKGTPTQPGTNSPYRDRSSVSSGFIYMVSSASVTGAQNNFGDTQKDYFKRIANMQLNTPQLVGFGISNAETYLSAIRYNQGAIIGSAFIQFLEKNGVDAIPKFIKTIR